MTALQWLLEEGSCQVRGEIGRREVIRLQLLLQCSSVVGRTMSSRSRRKIKETWIVRQPEDQVVEPVIPPSTNVDDQIHADSGVSFYQCDQCSKVCTSMKSVTDHKGRVHSEPKICDKIKKKLHLVCNSEMLSCSYIKVIDELYLLGLTSRANMLYQHLLKSTF